jgi:hypothetical protein
LVLPALYGFVYFHFLCAEFLGESFVVVVVVSGTTYPGRLIVLSILNDSFAGYSILGLKLFSSSAQKTSLHALLAFNVSVEKSAVILMGLLCMLFVFSLLQPSIFFV